MATETQGPRLEDPFDDEDLLDFEPRERREIVAAKMRQKRRVSPTLAWARILMYVQLVSPMLVIFGTALLGGATGGTEQAETPATTTTTVAQQTQGGGGGGGLMVIAIGFVWFAVVIAVAARLGRGSAGARLLALGTEGLILLFSVRVIAGGAGTGNGLWMSVVLGTFAVAIIVLLLSPSARKGVDTNVGDTSARFDIRNLPTLEP